MNNFRIMKDSQAVNRLQPEICKFDLMGLIARFGWSCHNLFQFFSNKC